MSVAVDSRIVEMQFDNRQFEAGVADSLSTLDRLKSSLRMDGAAKCFDTINQAANRVNMNGLGIAVDNVGLKFRAMYSVADQALRNITTRVQSTVERMAKALTIEPIMTGFSEYETKMGSIQTVLANTQSKGTTLEDVNKALGELNTYADKTIYNFSEMTRNVGTFTAAGVDLETSTKAIQGLANVAAVSGANATQASVAMYQMSQALATGTVRLMDWKSLENNSMGSVAFQEALKKTAKEHGIAIDDIIKEQGSFRESLSEGWLTNEIFLETLSKYTKTGANEYIAETSDLTAKQVEAIVAESSSLDEASEALAKHSKLSAEKIKETLQLAHTAEDAATKVKTFTQLWSTLKETAQSGWSQTWEIVIGDFEEAKEFLTKINDVVGEMLNSMSEARNNLLTGGLRGGWDQFLGEGITDESGFTDVVKDVAKEHDIAIDDLIKKNGSFEKSLQEGWMTSELLTESVGKYSKKLSGMSEKELKAAGFTKEYVDEMKALNEAVKDGSISVDEFVEKMARPSGRENLIESLWNVFDGIMEVIAPVKDALREIFPPMTAEQLYKITESLRDLTAKFTISAETADKIKRTFKGVFAILDIGVELVKAVAEGFGDLLKLILPAGDGLLGFTANLGDSLVEFRDWIKASGFFKNIIGGIVNAISDVIGALKRFGSFIKTTFENLTGAEFSIDVFTDRVRARFDQLAQVGEKLKNAFGAIGAFFKKIMSGLKPLISVAKEALSTVTEGIGDVINNTVKDANFNTFLDVANAGLLGALLIGIKKFIDKFTSMFGKDGWMSSLKKFVEDITKDFKVFVKSFKEMMGAVKDSLVAWQNSLKAEILLKIAKAIVIIAAALFVLALVDSDKLMAALAAVGGLFIGLTYVMNNLPKDIGKAAQLSGVMIAMSSSVLILAFALATIGRLDLDSVLVGLVGILGIFVILTGVLVAFSELSKRGRLGEVTVKIIGLSAAVLILAYACKVMGSMSWDSLARGLTGLTVALAGLTLAMRLMPKSSILQGAGLISAAIALTILAGALKLIGLLSWDEIGKGLVAIGAALTMLAIGLYAMTGTTFGAVSLIVASVALLAFAGALKVVSLLSWGEIGRGLVAIGGCLLVLAVGLTAMMTSLPGALALVVASLALAVMAPIIAMLGSMDWSGIVKGLVAIAASFVILGVAGYLLAPVVPVVLGLAGAFALLGVAWLAVGTGVLLLAAGIVALASAFSGGAVIIASGIKTVLTAIVTLIPHLVKAVAESVIEVLKVIKDGAPVLFETAKVIILGLLDVVLECLPKLLKGLLKLLSEWVPKIIDVLLKIILENVPKIAEAALQLILAALDLLVKYVPQIVGKIFDFVIGIINKLAEKVPELIVALSNLLISVLKGVIEALGQLDPMSLLKAIASIGILYALLIGLAGLAPLVPGAMIGVVGLGALVGEIAIVLGALGALAQIPGLKWLIGEGGDLLMLIGNALGGFVGGIVGGFAEGVTASFPQIATNLSDFMTNLQPFIDGAKQIDSAVLSGIESIVQSLLLITGADILDRITSFVLGESSIVTFGSQLGLLGTYLNTFTTNLGTFDESKVATVTCATKALKSIAEAARALPNEGGWAAKLLGDNSIATFGGYLPKLGTHLSGFATNLGTFDEAKANTIGCAANAIKMLAQAANELPNEGGWVAAIVGDNSIATFGGKLPQLGTDLSGFATNLGTFTEEQVNTIACASNAIKAMADAATDIDGQSEWAKKLFGDDSLAAFGGQLPTLGTNLSNFVTNLGKFDESTIATVQNAVSVISALAEMADADLKSAKKNLTGFSGQLEEFATDISEFVTDMPASEGVSTATTNLQTIVGVANTLASVDTSPLKNVGNALKELGLSGVDTFVDEFTSESASSSIASAIDTMIKGAISAAEEFYEGFSEAGAYLVGGFAAGISENTAQAETAARAMANAAEKAAKDALDINSPSKVFRAIGKGVPEGFAQGIDRLRGLVQTSAAGMADGAIGTVSNSISRISDMVSSDIDAQPTIRPVLDLSDIRSKAGAIGGMLNGTASVGVRANVGAINTMMNQRSQNGANAGLISEIKALRKDMANDRGNTYNLNGLSYEEGSDVAEAFKTIVRAAKVGRRV